jgi:hypothetical protein
LREDETSMMYAAINRTIGVTTHGRQKTLIVIYIANQTRFFLPPQSGR